MTRRWITYSFILSLTISLLWSPSVNAQSKSTKQQTEEQTDSVPLFNGISVSADIAGMIQYAVSDYGQFEGALRVNLFDTYFPIVEIGLGKASHDDVVTRIKYNSTAPYFRLGVDYNLMTDKHDAYRVYGGIRYAFTYFKYDISRPSLKDPIWGDDAPYGAEGVSCNYHWAEVVGGVDALICGPLRMGWSIRYRKRLSHNEGDLGKVWYVPGFGKAGSSRLGMTFNVSISF